MASVVDKIAMEADMTSICDPDWIRTNDPQLRRLMLYPAELPDRLNGGKIRKKMSAIQVLAKNLLSPSINSFGKGL